MSKHTGVECVGSEFRPHLGTRCRWLALGCWLAVNVAFAGAVLTREGKLLRLANEQVATTFNLASGEWEMMTADGAVLYSRLRCSWGSAPGNSSTQGLPTFSFMRVHQAMGRGTRLEISRGEKASFELLLTVFDLYPCVLAQIRSPLPESGTNAIPILFEGYGYLDTVAMPQRAIVFQATPAWAGTAQLLGNPGETNDVTLSSAGLLYLGENRQGKGTLLALVKDARNARLDAQPGSPNEMRGLKIVAAWPQALEASEQRPNAWESAPLLFSAPLSIPQAAALLRKAMVAYGPSSGSPPEVPAALERLAPGLAR